MEELQRVCQASEQAVNSVQAVYSREFEKELAGAVQDAMAEPGADAAAIYALVTQTVRRDVDCTPPAVHNALLQGLHPDTVIDPVKGTTVLHELLSRAYPPQLVGGYGGGEEEGGEDGSGGAAAAPRREVEVAGGVAEGVAEGVAAVDGGEAEGKGTAAGETSEGRDAAVAATNTGGPRAASALALAINAAIASATSAESGASGASGGTPAAVTAVPATTGGSAREESAGSGGAGGGISLQQFLDRGATPDVLDSGGNSALHLLLAGVASETMFPDVCGAAVLQVRDVEDMFGDADRVHYLDTVGRALMQAGWSMDLPNRKGNTCAKLLQLCRSRLESKGARMVQHASSMVGSETAQRLQKQLEHMRAVLDQLQALSS